MPNYRRAVQPGGTFFVTIVTHHRAEFLCDPTARQILRSAIQGCQEKHPFELEATVLLPDHFHAMIRLPEDDTDFSLRLAAVKAVFAHEWLNSGGVEQVQSSSRDRHRHRGVWQRRFWEHCVRDPEDFSDHLDYIHYNPVKHGLVTCPHLWPWSTFRKWVRRGVYPEDWLCVCDGRSVVPPTFERMPEGEME